ncbi:LysM peptidoglycan-binding domain-containing protein [Flavobacterium sp. FlaQc-30]|uniref:LysM peptidoglycan-binding domain-containing protein n=1 Tax=Flavobacterium sp. FlaQc-30 TaxID=3374179 RepID=UPI003757B840
MISFKKYKVQRGDTIEKIANKIGIPVKDVRAFHNQHCEISDLVEFGLPIRFVEYILLSDLNSYVDSKLSEQKALKKVFSNSENLLRLAWIENYTQEYGTIIQFRQNNQLKNKVHFTSKVEFLREQDNHFIVKLQVNQVYINDKEPNLVIEEFASEISKVLYPIVLCLTDRGAIHSILNVEDIHRRWKDLKPAILKYYKGGNVIQRLIYSFEKSIGSESLLRRSFEEHPFFQIFFAPIYQNHSSDLSFTSFGFQTQTFQSIDEFQTATSKICVRRKEIVSRINFNKGLDPFDESDKDVGDLKEIDLRKEEFERGKLEDGIDKNLDFQYKLHQDNKTIFSVSGFINSRLSNKTISTIEFETYAINNKKQKTEILNPVSGQIDWNLEIINEKEIKEPGFWEGFWGR